jgi:MOSC domain-containing protein YiiM
MESLVEPDGVVGGLVHRGGLNANVVESGTISEGDPIRY